MWGSQRFCISKRLPHDADAAGLHMLWASGSWVIIVLIICTFSKQVTRVYLLDRRKGQFCGLLFSLFGHNYVLAFRKKMKK